MTWSASPTREVLADGQVSSEVENVGITSKELEELKVEEVFVKQKTRYRCGDSGNARLGMIHVYVA